MVYVAQSRIVGLQSMFSDVLPLQRDAMHTTRRHHPLRILPASQQPEIRAPG